MKKKKWAIVAVSLLLAAVLGVGTYFAIPSIVVRNVFDEMYYSLKQEPLSDGLIFFGNSHYYTDTSFYRLPEVNKNELDKARNYQPPYVDGQTSIGINYEGNELIITSYHQLSSPNEDYEALVLIFAYSIWRKYLTSTLMIHSHVYSDIDSEEGLYKTSQKDLVKAFLDDYEITREQIEGYKHFVLYERLLPDWFAGNAGLSRYSPGNLGSFTYDDRTYEGLEGWTG